MSDTDDSEAVESGERHATSPSVDYVDDAGRRHTIDLSSHDYVTQRGQRASHGLGRDGAADDAWLTSFINDCSGDSHQVRVSMRDALRRCGALSTTTLLHVTLEDLLAEGLTRAPARAVMSRIHEFRVEANTVQAATATTATHGVSPPPQPRPQQPTTLQEVSPPSQHAVGARVCYFWHG